MSRYKRNRKFIEPRIQMKFALAFFTTAGIAIFGQTLLFGFLLDRTARSLENDGSLLRGQLPLILRDGFLLTAVVLVPLTVLVGIWSTFRVVGPLYRFRLFMNAVIAGEQHAPCRIRAGDELHDFCDLLNRVTEPRRAELAEAAAAEESGAATPEPALPRASEAQHQATA